MKNKKISEFFSRRVVILAISFIAAFVSWVAVVSTVNSTMTRTIYNVPVTIPDTGNSYQSLGLDILDLEWQNISVNVTVSGERGIVGALNRNSVTVTPIFANVTEAGTYELALQATQNSESANFEITNITPGYITLTFATVTSNTYPIEVVTGTVTAPDGYLIETIVTQPSEVTITGTQQRISEIARVVAYVDVEGELSSSYTGSSEIALLDANGERLSTDNLIIDVDTVDVTVPVYKTGTLALDIGFINIPDGFDISSLEYRLSVNEIAIAGPESIIDNLTTKTIGYIDLAQFSAEQSYTFEITLSTGIVNMDNITEVTVTFPSDDLTTKKVNVSDIRLENGSDQYTYTLVSSRINSVTVIGPSAEVQLLSAGSVVAIVDLSAAVYERGQYTVPVEFIIPSYPESWVVGSYTVVIEVSSS